MSDSGGTPPDLMQAPPLLQARLVERISSELGRQAMKPPGSRWNEPPWEEVAPGIAVKMLGTDKESHLVSMMVCLAAGVEYPPHTHAGVEELHLLYGELWINERKLYPGDYACAAPGTKDRRVWSATGCTCLLVTSARDEFL
jgi:anti-sigma factor ChrR (cupin superfamily)